MRVLFHSEGLETGRRKKEKKTQNNQDILGLLANGICFTLDFNTFQEQHTLVLCTHTSIPTPVLQTTARAGGLKPEPESGLKPHF